MDRVPVSSPMSGISHYVTERLVTTNPENAPIAQPGTPITHGRLLDTDFGPLPSSAALITIRRRTADQDSAPEPSREEQLAQLQFAAAAAEATARETTALAAASTSRRNIQLLDLGTQDQAHCTSPSTGSRSGSNSPSARPPTELATLLHLWQQQQVAAERREDDRRADDRHRKTERRNDRRGAGATAATRKARLEAVIASLSLLTAAPVATANMASTAGFKSNRSFEGVSVFSWDNGQSFRHWSVEFMAKAGIVGVVHDNLRELLLKLTGPAREFYDRQWAVTEDPELSVWPTSPASSGQNTKNPAC